MLCIFSEVPASDREADPKDGQGAGAEDGEQEEHDDRDDRDHDDDLDDESIFTCDNCQHDFDCLAELTEHRTNHCPAGKMLMWIVLARPPSLFHCVFLTFFTNHRYTAAKCLK